MHCKIVPPFPCAIVKNVYRSYTFLMHVFFFTYAVTFLYQCMENMVSLKNSASKLFSYVKSEVYCVRYNCKLKIELVKRCLPHSICLSVSWIAQELQQLMMMLHIIVQSHISITDSVDAIIRQLSARNAIDDFKFRVEHVGILDLLPPKLF